MSFARKMRRTGNRAQRKRPQRAKGRGSWVSIPDEPDSITIHLTQPTRKVHLGDEWPDYTVCEGDGCALCAAGDTPEALGYYSHEDDEFLPFKIVLQHFINGWKGRKGIGGPSRDCSIGLPGEDYNGNCAYCHEVEYGTNDNQVQPARDTFAFGVRQEQYFHLVDKTQDGKTFKTLEDCTGGRCSLCRNGTPKVFGKKGYIQFPLKYFDQLSALTVEFEKFCLDCGSTQDEENGTVDVSHFFCPECEEVIFEVDPDTTEDEFKRYADNENRCPKCGYRGLLESQLVCFQCWEESQGERTGRPASLFDVQLTLQRTGTAPQYSLNIIKWKVKELDERLFDEEEQAGSERPDLRAAGMAEDYDLDEIFKPKKVEDQVRELGLRKNPFSPEGESEDSGRSQAARQYSRRRPARRR